MSTEVLAHEARELSYAFKHIKIIDKLSQCKVATVKDLYEWSGYEKSYQGFRRLVQRLEKSNVLSSFKHMGSAEKYIFIPDSINKKIWSESSSKLNKETLFHDAMTTKILMSLYKSKFIDYFALEHDFESLKHIFKDLDSIVPDAIGISKNPNLKFAFEIEINQKSRNRVFEKVIQFSNNDEIDHVLYFFPSKNIYKNYCLRLMELHKLSDTDIQNRLKKKISLIYNDTLLWGTFNSGNCEEFNLSSKKIFQKGH